MATIYYWRDVMGYMDLFAPYAEEIDRLLRGEHGGLRLEKLRIPTPTPIYSIRVNKETRLLFTTYEGHLCLLDVVLNHDYAKSRFLRDPRVLRAFLKERLIASESVEVGSVVSSSDFVGLEEAESADLPKDATGSLRWMPLDYYQHRLIRFSTEQEGVLQTSLPAVVYGPAGSGKSCVAFSLLLQYVRDHQDEAALFPIVYVSRSEKLVGAMSTLWREMGLSSDDESRVHFKTYKALMAESGDVSIAEDALFFEWYESKKRSLLRGGAGGVATQVLDPATVLQEFRIRCGYLDDETYLSLGGRRTGVAVESRILVCRLYDAFRAYLASLGQVMMSLHAFSERSAYPMVVVDEAQDLSYGQLQGLYDFSGGKILYLLGEHQVLFDGKSRLPYLKELLYRATGSEARMIELKASYRCSERVSAVANALIQLKYQATGGASDKSESCRVAVVSEQLGKGEALWLSHHDEAAIAIFVAAAQQPTLAVVTLPAFESEAKVRFKTELVFTPDSIKGLEFDTVVIWRLLDNEEALLASSKLVALSPETLKQHRAKAGEGDDTHLAFFNELITAVTRARQTLVVVQDSRREIHQLVDGLMPCFTTTAAPRVVSGPVSQTAWADVERQLRAVGDVARADAIRRDKLRDVAVMASLVLDDESSLLFDDEIGMIRALKEGVKLDKAVRERLSKALSVDGRMGVEKTLLYALIKTPFGLDLLIYLKTDQSGLFRKIPTEIWYQTRSGSALYPLTLIHDLVKTKKGRSILKDILSLMPSIFWKKTFLNIASLEHPNTLWPCLVNSEDGLVIMKTLCQERSRAMESVLSDVLRSLKNDGVSKPVSLIFKELVDSLEASIKLGKGTTPACHAAVLRFIPVLYILYAFGADLNTSGKDGWTPAGVAAQLGFVDVLCLLHKFGADLKIVKNEGWTLACIAAKIGRIDVIRALKTLSIDLDEVTTDGVGWTPAGVAAKFGHVAVLRELKALDADLNKEDSKGCTPAFIAALCGHTHILRELKYLGADIDRPSTQGGNTPLFIAAEYGRRDVICELKALGANLNETMNEGMTMTMRFVEQGKLDMIRLFGELGADFNQATNDGFTPVFVAAQLGRVDLIRVLTAHGALLDKAGQDGGTPVTVATQMGHLDVLRVLKELGASFEQEMFNGCTPAYIAAQHGYLDIVSFFIEQHVSFQRAFVCSSDLFMTYDTSVHEDIKVRMSDTIDALIGQGCHRDHIPLLPIDIAFIMGHQEIVRRLRLLPARHKALPPMVSVLQLSLFSMSHSSTDEESRSPFTPMDSSMSSSDMSESYDDADMPGFFK